MASMPLPSRFRNERQKVGIAHVSNAGSEPEGKKKDYKLCALFFFNGMYLEQCFSTGGMRPTFWSRELI